MSLDIASFQKINRLPINPVHILGDPTSATRPANLNREIESLYRLAASEEAVGNLAGVVDKLRKAYLLDRNQPQILLILSQLFKVSGELRIALSLLKQVYEVVQDEQVSFLYANWLSEANDFPSLVEVLEKLLHKHKNKAAILRYLGAAHGTLGNRALSEHYLVQAAKRLPVFHDHDKTGTKLRVAIITSSIEQELRLGANLQLTSTGGNNFPNLLDTFNVGITEINVDAEVSKNVLRQGLKGVNILYNTISQPHSIKRYTSRIENIERTTKLPLINKPAAVERCARERLFERYGGMAGVKMPRTKCVDQYRGSCRDVLCDILKNGEFDLPIIVRLSDYDTGRFLHLVHDPDSHDFSELDEQLTKRMSPIEFIEYVDVSAPVPDGPVNARYYTKYRAFMVDNKLFPMHLFAGESFNVHHKDALLFKANHKFIDQLEHDYLENPQQHLGSSIWQNLTHIMLDIGLDYFGVDFSVKTEGAEKSVVIFEANPAMRIPLGERYSWDPAYLACRDVTIEAHKMLCRKSGVTPWDFIIHSGLRI